ncbi:unnamed protein product [Acanthoscelides obtectus]|uniref:Uncharacterized protein n=1 Tax=Acanthoscelides obtectus TaxID=200917 RepID=A0A9P0LPY9_ACAOB|nr:unnamed protein product [Acanthoscelides obtectus]CAK1672155.1 hypothetical protein AOBTE_LOCUS28682 [Acanthoscelides obtectus]
MANFVILTLAMLIVFTLAKPYGERDREIYEEDRRRHGNHHTESDVSSGDRSGPGKPSDQSHHGQRNVGGVHQGGYQQHGY